MAEGYSSEVNIGSGGYQKYRAHLVVEVEYISSTQAKVNYTAYAEGINFYGFGMKISVLNGTSAEGQHPSAGHDHTHLDQWASDIYTTGSFVVDRQNATYDFSVTATVGPGAASQSQYGSVPGGEVSVTVTVSIDEIPSDCYVKVNGQYMRGKLYKKVAGVYVSGILSVHQDGDYKEVIP